MSFIKRPFDENNPHDRKVAEVCRQVFDILDTDVNDEMRPEVTISVGMALILVASWIGPLRNVWPPITASPTSCRVPCGNTATTSPAWPQGQ